jgi:hypothetical protein
MSLEADLRAGAAKVIAVAGADFELVAPNGANPRPLRVASFTNTEEIIINAYGADAMVGYSLPIDPVPVKFERLRRAGEADMVVHAVKRYEPNGVLIALKYVLKR